MKSQPFSRHNCEYRHNALYQCQVFLRNNSPACTYFYCAVHLKPPLIYFFPLEKKNPFFLRVCFTMSDWAKFSRATYGRGRRGWARSALSLASTGYAPGGYLNRRYGVRGAIRRGATKRRRLYTAPRLNARTAGYIGMEVKFYDLHHSGLVPYLPASTAVDNCMADPTPEGSLFNPVQGADPTQRVGRKVTVKQLQIVGTVHWDAMDYVATTVYGAPVWFYVIQDTQTNKAQMLSGDYLTNPGAMTDKPPLLNLQSGHRFKTLAKKVLQTNDIFATSSGVKVSCNAIPFDITIPIPDVVVNYIANSATVASIIDHSFHVIAFTPNHASRPTLFYNCRTRFVG